MYDFTILFGSVILILWATLSIIADREQRRAIRNAIKQLSIHQ